MDEVNDAGERETFKRPARSYKSPDRKSVKLKQEVGPEYLITVVVSAVMGASLWRRVGGKKSSTLFRLSLKRTERNAKIP